MKRRVLVLQRGPLRPEELGSPLQARDPRGRHGSSGPALSWNSSPSELSPIPRFNTLSLKLKGRSKFRKEYSLNYRIFSPAARITSLQVAHSRVLLFASVRSKADAVADSG